MVELSNEKAILGKILVFPNMLENAMEHGLKEEYFLNMENRDIYRQILKIYYEHGVFERSFLKVSREKQIELGEESNGVVYMGSGVKALKEEYKNIYLDKKVNEVLESEDLNTDEKRKEIIAVVEKIGEFEAEKNKLLTPKSLLSEWWQDLEKKELDGILTGYSDLDKYIFLEKASLITIGARPAMGKTAFGLNLAYKNAEKHNVMYINLEMNTKQITNRILASMSGVSLKKLKDKTVDESEIKEVSRNLGRFEKLNLSILDCMNTNFDVIMNEIKKIHEKNPFDLIVIDYLTLMHAKGHTSKNLEVEYMANKLKTLSKELDTCVVILAQLSRDVEKRADKRPVVSDLRDSGGIEQASNIVMFLYRDDYYNQSGDENKEKLSILETIIRKNRDGDIGTVCLAYNRITQEIRTVKRQLKLVENTGVDEDDKKHRLYE